MIDDPYDLPELDKLTRALMLEEVEIDLVEYGHLYLGKNLTERGLTDYPELLRRAIVEHDEGWLTARLNEDERVTLRPVDAARRIACTEFNRYYIRGICRRAEQHQSTTIVPYRARGSIEERTASVLLDKEPQSAPRILANLRGRAIQGDPESGLGKVNSGMSARCGCDDCLRA